jgi:hypothetical protein
MRLGFYGTVFVLGLLGYIGYAVGEPVVLHYREKYAGHWLRFSWKAFVYVVTAVCVVSMLSAAPAYFWWILLAGLIITTSTARAGA